MKTRPFRRIVAWLVTATLLLTQTAQVVALTLAQAPLAGSTTSTVRPNVMYVLDDSGSMAWDYTPDYINDAMTASDFPNSVGGSIGDSAYAVVSAGGAVTEIVPANGTWSTAYKAGVPTILIQGGGTGAAAKATLDASYKIVSPVTVTTGGSGYGNTSVTTTGSGTSGQKNITVGSTSGIQLGYSVTGTGIAAKTFVQTVTGNTVTLNNNTSAAVSGNLTFRQAPFVVLIGGLQASAWGLCWGTTGASNAGGVPKDTVQSPVCTTNSQPPYATSKINYQYYDPAVRYEVPRRAAWNSSCAVGDSTCYYPNSTPAAALSNGFSGATTKNLTTGWTHEVWCSVASPSPAVTAANIATHAQCKENSDTTGNALYPNATYTFKKTYTGAAAYFTMSPSEYCTDDSYTQCVRGTTPWVSPGGVVYNIPSYYRWCSYYNPQTHSFGTDCQASRDLSHYIPNYLGGWESTGSAGVQATAEVKITSVTPGQSITALNIGTVNAMTNDLGVSSTITALTGDTPTTIAAAVCAAVNANTGTSGYGCSPVGDTAVITAAAVGTAANGLPVVAAGPPVAAAANSTGELRVLSVTPGYSISAITITRTDTTTRNLIANPVYAGATVALTAQAICQAINANPENAGTYSAKSGTPGDLALNYGTCLSTTDGFIGIKRLTSDTDDNGATIVVTGPTTATTNAGTLTVNSVGGATRIDDITLGGVSILNPKPLNSADGTLTNTIAAEIASKITAPGCTAAASGSTVIISGTCTGVLAVSSSSANSTAVFNVDTTGNTNAADLGYIRVGVGGTEIVGHITSAQITDGSAVATNATLLADQINLGTGTHFFSAVAAAAASGSYNVTVTAPAGGANSGKTFDFGHGTTVGGVTGADSTWSFRIDGASLDSATMHTITCGAVANITTGNGTTGAGTASEFLTNISSGGSAGTRLSGMGANGYSWNCDVPSGSGSLCTLTGPTGVSACPGGLNLTNKDPSIVFGTPTVKTSGTAATQPTWTFDLSAASKDLQKIGSITCGGTAANNNVISVDTVSTGTATTAYLANLTTIATTAPNINGGLNGRSANGFAWSCSAPGSCILTGTSGTIGATVCPGGPTFNLDSGLTGSATAGAAGATGTPKTWQFTFSNANSSNQTVSSIRCGTGSSDPQMLASNISTGSPAGTDYAARLATAINSSAPAQNGWKVGASNCTSSGTTVNCSFQRDSGASNRCSSVSITPSSGQTLTPGAVTESGTSGAGYIYSFAITNVTAPSESITQITCNGAATGGTNEEAMNSTATRASGDNTSDFATRIDNAATGINHWQSGGNCARINNTSGNIGCTFRRSAGTSYRCLGGVQVTGSGVTPTTPVESLSSTTYSYYWEMLDAGETGDAISSVRCNNVGGTAGSTSTALSGTASTGATADSDTVQRLNSLRTALNGQSKDSGSGTFTWSCPTAATNASASVTCTASSSDATCTSTSLRVTGSNSSGIYISGNTNQIDNSARNYTVTYSAGSGATAPTWNATFGVTTGADDLKINSVQCNGVNTFSTASPPNTGKYDWTRINNLATSLASNGANSYSVTSCGAALTSASSPVRRTCTITGPAGAKACPDMVLTTNPASGSGITATHPGNGTAGGAGSSPSWEVYMTEAGGPNKTITSLTCGGVNTIGATPDSGTSAASNVWGRINSLRSTLAGTSGYTIGCLAASSGVPYSDCTVTKPMSAPACSSFTFPDKDASISIINMAQGNIGRPSTASTDDYMARPALTPVNGGQFSVGYRAQPVVPTNVVSTTQGTISTSNSNTCSGVATTTMCNGSPVSAMTIPTTATGSAPNTRSMADGAEPDTSANKWKDVGILKRIDIVSTNNSYNRASGRTDCVSATCTYNEEMQNFANWYTYYSTRMQMMKSASTLAFSGLDEKYRVGYDNICGSDTGTEATVGLGVAQFVDSGGEVANQRTSWWTKLTATSPSCATPLRSTTAKLGRYYAGKLGITAAQPDPLQYSCQQNFMMLVTDGYWNENDTAAIKKVDGTDIGNQDNNSATVARPFYDGQMASTTCPNVGSGRGANPSSCRNMSDIAWYYYSTDLRTTALGNSCIGGNNLCAAGSVNDVSTNNVLISSDDSNTAQHMVFYAMGLGIDGTLPFRSDYQTAGLGAYAEIKAGTRNWPAVMNLDPTGVDDLWHATVNGHGKYFSARNVPNVVAGLKEALNKIGARVGSASASATSNLRPVTGDNFAYVANYTTVDWVGDLQSRTINLTNASVSEDGTHCGVDLANCQWSAQSKLDSMSWSARRIYVQPTSVVSGDPLRAFSFANLTGPERTSLEPGTAPALSQYATLVVSNPADITTSNLVDYLRGNRGLEQDGDVSHPQIWRKRAHVLGDIVDTSPVFVKVPDSKYTDAGYDSFKTSSAAASRRPVVFIGAQDGMLHAINAHNAAVTVVSAAVQPGEEMWAYIPQQSLVQMKTLGDPNYVHRFFMDGPMTVGDVNFGGGANDWHTILVAGQGAGGKSYIALDVTDPTTPVFLWEFSDSTRLGYTLGNAEIKKLPGGEWAVLFSSGYNNTDGNGYLFALNPKTGVVKTGFPLATGSGSAGAASNLGKITIWMEDSDHDPTAQYVYAGDTFGGVWRFDMDPSAAGHSGIQIYKLAHLTYGGVDQPITTRLEVNEECGSPKVRVVYVGTGQYLATADLLTTGVQSFYAIKDPLAATPTPQTAKWALDGAVAGGGVTPVFQQRVIHTTWDDATPITTTVNGVTTSGRIICRAGAVLSKTLGACVADTGALFNWATSSGWFINYPESGERMNIDVELIQGIDTTLAITSNIPGASSCTVGGVSRNTQVNACSGLDPGPELPPVPPCVGPTCIADPRGPGYPSRDPALTPPPAATINANQDCIVVGNALVQLPDGSVWNIQTCSDGTHRNLQKDVTTSPIFNSKRNVWREFEAY